MSDEAVESLASKAYLIKVGADWDSASEETKNKWRDHWRAWKEIRSRAKASEAAS